MTFGQKLKAYREEKKLTLDELATMLGTTKQVLSRYERGERTPKITTAREYAKIMGVNFTMLIDEAMDFSIDVPHNDEPQTSPMTDEEQQFLQLIRQLSPQGRAAAAQMLQSLKALQEQSSAVRE